MRRILSSIACGSVLIAGGAGYAEDLPTYLCIAEKMTGFAHGNNDWKHTRFNPTEKFLIKGETQYDVFPFGADEPTYFDCDTSAAGFTLRCSGWTGQFLLNLNNNRFVASNAWGYIYSDKADLFLAIGKCSKL